MTDLVERLRDDAAQLTRAAANANLAGGETYVRVYDPAILTKDLTEAASRISQQDAELERVRREVEEARRLSSGALDEALFMREKAIANARERNAAEAKLAEARKAAFIEAAEIAEETAQGSDHLLKAAGQAKDIQGALVHGEGVMTARIIATALRRKAEETRT